MALSVMVLIGVSKTLLTKLLFEHIGLPVAFSVLSCVATNMCILPIFIFCGGRGNGSSFTWLKWRMVPRFAVVCAAIAIDLACTNVALSLLSVVLQQTIKATSPTATVLVESLIRRKLHHPVIYITVVALCLGPFLIVQGKQQQHEVNGNSTATAAGEDDTGSEVLGVVMMVAAVIGGAFKYVLAHATIKQYRDELGVLAFTFWVEIFAGTMLLPWALASGEMQALMSGAGRSVFDWILLWGAAAFGGVRIYSQFAFLSLTSATSLATSNLAVQALTIILGVLAFGTEATPTLMGGVVLTLAISAAYTFLRTTRLLEMHPTCSTLCRACVRSALLPLTGARSEDEIDNDMPSSEMTGNRLRSASQHEELANTA